MGIFNSFVNWIIGCDEKLKKHYQLGIDVVSAKDKEFDVIRDNTKLMPLSDEYEALWALNDYYYFLEHAYVSLKLLAMTKRENHKQWQYTDSYEKELANVIAAKKKYLRLASKLKAVWEAQGVKFEERFYACEMYLPNYPNHPLARIK